MPVHAHAQQDREALMLRLNILQVVPTGKVAEAAKEDIYALLRPEGTQEKLPLNPEDEETDPRRD